MSSLWLEMEDFVQHTRFSVDAMDLFSVIAYEIDYAFNRDKGCEACCNLRVIAAVHEYVGRSEELGDVRAAKALARDSKQNRCDKCKEQEKQRKEQMK